MNIDVAEILQELREWATTFGLSKYNLFLLFIGVLIFKRLPVILKHIREMRAIKLDFISKGKKLQAKIDEQKEKRRQKRNKDQGKL